MRPELRALDPVDADWLLAHVLGVSRSELALRRDDTLTSDQAEQLEALAVRRVEGEPLQYVLGEWGFRRLTLTVDRRALIPRPETEHVVERCLALLQGVERPRVLDVGTGSGAIALAIADERDDARVTGIDVSEEALALAAENVRRTGVSIELLRHDVTDGLPGRGWHLVVSNPPYIPTEELGTLDADVVEWEPHVALVARGQTEALVRAARTGLRPGGALVVETSERGASPLAALLVEAGLVDVRTTPDLAGRDRVVEGRRAP